MDFKESLNMPKSLKHFLGHEESYKFDRHQKKLVENIKECANDQWAYVNSYYDGDEETAYKFFNNPEAVYDLIEYESGTTIYEPGFTMFGEAAASYLNDTKFAGNAFKKKVVFFYVVDLYDEVTKEIPFDERKLDEICDRLQVLKRTI